MKPQRLIRTPTNPLVAVREKLYKEKADREIYEAIGFVRGLIAGTGENANVSADLILEQLAERDSPLKAAYEDALALLRLGRTEELTERFSQAAGTRHAQDFIRLIVRWEQAAPEKLASTLLSYQSAMKEMRTTRIKKRTETLSDLAFIPVITNVMLIFMNFIIVAYFIGQKDLLTRMFM